MLTRNESHGSWHSHGSKGHLGAPGKEIGLSHFVPCCSFQENGSDTVTDLCAERLELGSSLVKLEDVDLPTVHVLSLRAGSHQVSFISIITKALLSSLGVHGKTNSACKLLAIKYFGAQHLCAESDCRWNLLRRQPPISV